MFEIFIITVLIMAIGMAFLCVKLFLPGHRGFSSQHIHDSEALKEKGIHCVMDQDREMRSKKKK